MKAFERILLKKGFEKRRYGFVLDSGNLISFAVTLFDNNKVQMFGFYTDEPDSTKVFDSGVVQVSENEFKVLISVFFQHLENYK